MRERRLGTPTIRVAAFVDASLVTAFGPDADPARGGLFDSLCGPSSVTVPDPR